MAIVYGGLFGLEARGQYGKTLIYQRRMRQDTCAHYHRPGGGPSALQANERDYARGVMRIWRKIVSEEFGKGGEWQKTARYLGVRNTALGLFLQQSKQMQPLINGTAQIVSAKCKLLFGRRVQYMPMSSYDSWRGVPYRVILDAYEGDGSDWFLEYWYLDWDTLEPQTSTWSIHGYFNERPACISAKFEIAGQRNYEIPVYPLWLK